MTTLHFNTDTGRQTATALGTARGNIESELANMASRVNAMVGTEWQGQSALQFQNEFETWAVQLRSQLETLSNLQDRLNAEIANWEAVASQLGG
jgi:WXG100 family type VII secretion target